MNNVQIKLKASGSFTDKLLGYKNNFNLMNLPNKQLNLTYKLIEDMIQNIELIFASPEV